MARIEGDDLETCRHKEEDIFEARRKLAAAHTDLARAEMKYKSFISELTGAGLLSLELTSTGPCKVFHCVYDLRDILWPRCVFCGSPKYGD